jgi:hypothetical protein
LKVDKSREFTSKELLELFADNIGYFLGRSIVEQTGLYELTLNRLLFQLTSNFLSDVPITKRKTKNIIGSKPFSKYYFEKFYSELKFTKNTEKDSFLSGLTKLFSNYSRSHLLKVFLAFSLFFLFDLLF